MALAVLLLAPASASASKFTHVFLEDFGSANQPSFSKPQGLAVDQSTGDLLVIDRSAGTLSRFHADGTPAKFEALGSNTISGLAFARFPSPGEVQVAVDESAGETDGDIYVTEPQAGTLGIYSSAGVRLGELSESSEGPLEEVCGVAVDPSGNVYVDDFSSQVHEYEPAANPVVNADSSANFAFAEGCTMAAGAGASDGFIFPARFNGKVAKLESSAPGAEKHEVDPGPTTTVTVDPATGHLYAAVGNEVREYDAAGAGEATLLSSFSRGNSGEAVSGIAVDEVSGEVYVSRNFNPKIEVWSPAAPVPEAITEAASPVGGEAATLHGEVGAAGGPPASCQFQYTTEAAFNSNGFTGASSALCSPPGPFTGSSLEAVSAEVHNLTPGTSYRFRVVATNIAVSSPERSSNEGALSFKTLGPTILEESASEITETAATIGGQINPNGEATTFAVQYVSAAEFQKSGYNHALTEPVPPEAIGSGNAPLEVSLRLTSLAPGTAYHYRLLASAPAATARGPDEGFATYPIEAGLADGRAYEMVSPPKKDGEVFLPEPEAFSSCPVVCITPTVTRPMQSSPDGDSVVYEGDPFSAGSAGGANEYLAGRGTGGWSSEGLSPAIITGRYEAFSPDLTESVLYQIEPTLSPAAPMREGKGFTNLYLRSAGGSFTPLVTIEPPHREPGEPNSFSNIFEVIYAGANAGTALTPGFSRFLVEANDALSGPVAGIAPAAPAVAPGEKCANAGADCNLYEWEGGKLALVNVLPGNVEAASHSTFGSGRLLGNPPEYEAPNVDHAISADGSRVFWGSEETGHVYERIDGNETLEVPGPGACKGSLPQRVCFLAASADGSKVLLSNGELFELDEAEEAYEPPIDLTEGEEGFLGILGAAEDLSRIYFVDTKVLSGEENGNEDTAEEGKDNLYAWDEGALSFIGVLNADDNNLGTEGRYGDWKASRPDRFAQASPDGSYLAFMSTAPLTEYDNAGKSEVYEYAAGSGTLACASCNPSGQRPLGPSRLSLIQPGTIGNGFPPYPQPGNLSRQGNGRLFFESQDALSPGDVNGHIQDVYEWEPNGVGSCASVKGCVFLISSGHSSDDSMFLDSTPSGDDAFFITRQQLLPRDRDEQLDLYDARVGGGFKEEEEAAVCEGRACRGPFSSPPAAQVLGSATFSGPGNQQPTKHKKHKHKRRKRKRDRGGPR